MKEIEIVPTEKTKVQLTSLGNLNLNQIIDPNDFTVNLLFNGKFAINMSFEQWEGFVKEVMRLWAGKRD